MPDNYTRAPIPDPDGSYRFLLRELSGMINVPIGELVRRAIEATYAEQLRVIRGRKPRDGK